MSDNMNLCINGEAPRGRHDEENLPPVVHIGQPAERSVVWPSRQDSQPEAPLPGQPSDPSQQPGGNEILKDGYPAYIPGVRGRPPLYAPKGNVSAQTSSGQVQLQQDAIRVSPQEHATYEPYQLPGRAPAQVELKPEPPIQDPSYIDPAQLAAIEAYERR